MVAICCLVSEEAHCSSVRHFIASFLPHCARKGQAGSTQKTNDNRGKEIVTLIFLLALPMERVDENSHDVTEFGFQTVNGEGVRTVIDVNNIEKMTGLKKAE